MELSRPPDFGSPWPRVIIGSDYSGQQKGSRFETYAFLIADETYLWRWDELRSDIRKRILHDTRRMSFKNLNDKKRKRALKPFLTAANWIPGVCFTFVVEKAIGDLFYNSEEWEWLVRTHDISTSWKRSVRERVLRIAHFSALITAGMSRSGQDVLWVTDSDDIAANETILAEACKISGSVLTNYLSHDLGNIRFGTAKQDAGSMAVKDFVAIPDLVAGTLADAAPEIVLRNAPGVGGFAISRDSYSKSKVRTIMDWISDTRHSLKKVIVTVVSDGKGGTISRCTQLSLPRELLH